jgi:hypothetical protein
MKNADMTGEKNKRQKTSYSSGYYGKFIIRNGTFSEYTRYENIMLHEI